MILTPETHFFYQVFSKTTKWITMKFGILFPLRAEVFTRNIFFKSAWSTPKIGFSIVIQYSVLHYNILKVVRKGEGV